MTSLRKILLAAAFSVVAMGQAATAAPLKIGVTPGAIADSVNTAAVEARKQGLEVEVVEFTEWRGPNTALAAGDLDANYFQHLPFLENAVKEGNYEFTPVAVGLLPNVGLFSLKHASFAALPKGATVAVASDPANQGRGLLLLERAGVIGLKPDRGASATVNDIVDNPRKLRFVEIDGAQIVRALEEVDLAYGVTSHYVNAGKADIADKHGLVFSGVDDARWAIHFVSRKNNADDPRLGQFIRIYHDSPAVRQRIDKSYANNKKFYSLPWVNTASADAK